MKSVIVIPARLTAERLPGKPLLLLGDVPLVIRVAQQALKATKPSRVVIASDADDVLEAARRFDIEGIKTRPDHLSGTERVAEAAQKLAATHVINVQGDEPFIRPGAIDTVHDLLAKGAEIATLQTKMSDPDDISSPHRVKVVCDDNGRALYFSRSAIPYGRSEFSAYMGHVGIYGYQRQALQRWVALPPHPLEQAEHLEQLRPLAAGIPITVATGTAIERGIDVEADLDWARNKFATLGEEAFPDV